MLEEEASRRQLSGLKHLNESIVATTSWQRGSAVEIAAAQAGVGTTVVHQAKAVKKANPGRTRADHPDILGPDLSQNHQSLQEKNRSEIEPTPYPGVDHLEMIKGAIVDANASFRGRTEPVPLDTATLDRSPLTDSQGNLLAYTKPLIVLVDEMSASGAEVFAAGIQDNARGRLVGWRTAAAWKHGKRAATRWALPA